ncbi:MAG: M3 family metallopeptidase [Gemmatimonadota bacterium]
MNDLTAWSGPYGGVPPFDRIDTAAFEPALEAAMAANLEEIDRIAGDPSPPTFANTVAALERSGRALDRAATIYGVWSSNMSTPAFQAVEREMAPRMAAFSDRITQNDALFERIARVYEARQDLTPEQQRLTWLYHTNFVRAGAALETAAKARLSGINQSLARLFTQFSQNLLEDETRFRLVLEHESELAGLPDSLRHAAADAATDAGLAGKWVIGNTRSFIEPLLTYADDRSLRERAWRMWSSRGDSGDEHDNGAIVTGILRLRAERADLLGYETHAHWQLEHSMARQPERALELMRAVWTPAVARVAGEVRDMQEVARAAGHDIDIEPWDYRYYAEKVRRLRYGLDQNEVKQYLQLDRLRDAMFWVAGELFDLTFSAVDEVPVYHQDVRVWEVTDARTQAHVGLWYFDPYARPGKRSGAWMAAYRTQERFDGAITTIVSNNSNFVPGAPGEPVHISWDDATTLFHEFGHALHGLLSAVMYPSLSGTAVARDYVEFPSQLLEHWLSTPEVLQRFATHAVTGEPLPAMLVECIERTATFNQGFATAEYLASAIVDMELHLSENRDIDPAAFERDTLARIGAPHEIVMRHRTPQFQHVFGNDGYSAAYYSYLWADMLTADAYGAFTEAGGPYDRAVAQRLREHVLVAGNTVDPAAAYRTFRGRDAGIEPLLRKRGLNG